MSSIEQTREDLKKSDEKFLEVANERESYYAVNPDGSRILVERFRNMEVFENNIWKYRKFRITGWVQILDSEGNDLIFPAQSIHRESVYAVAEWDASATHDDETYMQDDGAYISCDNCVVYKLNVGKYYDDRKVHQWLSIEDIQDKANLRPSFPFDRHKGEWVLDCEFPPRTPKTLSWDEYDPVTGEFLSSHSILVNTQLVHSIDELKSDV